MTEGHRVYDYIIVGAGSAGCVLANRLSADPDNRVLVLEAGSGDNGLMLRMPAMVGETANSPRYSWGYQTEPQEHLNGRRIPVPRGKVLGGSSAINGMVYMRGHAYDYDRWAEETGAEHWRYRHCLPYFKRAQCHELGADDYRGGDGPLKVGRVDSGFATVDAFVEAGIQAGWGATDDVNGYRQEGFGRMDMTISDGERCGTARGYLRPAMTRPNLTVLTHAHTLAINTEGNRATGVRFAKGNQVLDASAEQEMIISCGVTNSPQLLMLSGIGPEAQLREHGIEVKIDLPGVGENLHDHLEIFIQHACLKPISLHNWLKPHNKLRLGIEWILFKKGLCASNHFEVTGFIRVGDDVTHPDVEYHYMPIGYDYGNNDFVKAHSFQAEAGTLRATSRGWLRLRSADPAQAPVIDPNNLQTERDRIDFRRTFKATREICAQKAYDGLRGEELSPGKDVKTDAEIDEYIRNNAGTVYHPCGTCKMGTDKMAVVDAKARVHGIEGLRVIDASIMPSIVSGNLNAPTIMMAEKLADMILGAPPPRPLDVPVWDHRTQG